MAQRTRNHQRITTGTITIMSQRPQMKRSMIQRWEWRAATACCIATTAIYCAFLLQVRSEQPKLVAAVVWQQVVSVAPATLQRSYSPISVGPHAPRGPPLGLA